MADIRAHPQTVRVKECILAVVKADERGRVRLSDPRRRQAEGHFVLENYDSLCVTKLIEILPRRSRVFSRAIHRGGAQAVLSRLEVYYPLENSFWRLRNTALLVVWVIVPLLALCVLKRDV